ncbi:MAG: DUF5319 domain-containing protein [Candidatus Corynebacterium faecigallinarum]|uniref:DUF5319 domain-containing protein n=1 Tax=Candidatus Corynebacterium faecigallinarum TaxID=2838528 RepID=A0A9D2QD56_9CORY|nr:DUF5319 domain-containing protein [Candidatus Corynebacterium faecigallinarum]
MNFDDSQMPPDPFADDPVDPAELMEDEGYDEPLSDEERMALREDLANVRRFRELLEPRGVLGVEMTCEDCHELHYYDWPILVSNLATMLNGEPVPVHEPGAAPDPDFYVSWDYCAGYADAADWLARAPRTFRWRR